VLTAGYLSPVTEGVTVGLTTNAGLGVAVSDADFVGSGAGRASFQVGAGTSAFFVGAGSTARVGVGTLTPAGALDVRGGSICVEGIPTFIDKYNIIKSSRSVLNQSVTIAASIGNTSVTHSSFGPVTIGDGVTVTVDSGATWTIT